MRYHTVMEYQNYKVLTKLLSYKNNQFLPFDIYKCHMVFVLLCSLLLLVLPFNFFFFYYGKHDFTPATPKYSVTLYPIPLGLATTTYISRVLIT